MHSVLRPAIAASARSISGAKNCAFSRCSATIPWQGCVTSRFFHHTPGSAKTFTFSAFFKPSSAAYSALSPAATAAAARITATTIATSGKKTNFIRLLGWTFCAAGVAGVTAHVPSWAHYIPLISRAECKAASASRQTTSAAALLSKNSNNNAAAGVVTTEKQDGQEQEEQEDTSSSSSSLPPQTPQPELNLRHFWNLVRPDLLWLLGAVAAALAAALVNVRIPALLGEVVNGVSDNLEPHLMASRAKTLLALYAVQAGLTAAYIGALGLVGERVAERLRNDLFSSYLRQEIAFFDGEKLGALSTRLTADVQEFKSSMKQVVSLGLRAATQVGGSLVSMYLVSPQLTVGLAVFVPAVIGVGT